MSDAIVSFSGGLDSTVCLYWARERFDRVFALMVDWRQKSIEYEKAAARTIAAFAGVPLKIVECPAFADLETPLTLTDPNPPGRTMFTRNIVFHGLAARYAEALGRSCDTIIVGSTADDRAPDGRRDVLDLMQQALGLTTERLFHIEAPLGKLTKRDVVQLARELPGCWEAVAHSVTCYVGTRCGVCPVCVMRAKGFRDAGLEDPAA